MGCSILLTLETLQPNPYASYFLTHWWLITFVAHLIEYINNDKARVVKYYDSSDIHQSFKLYMYLYFSYMYNTAHSAKENNDHQMSWKGRKELFVGSRDSCLIYNVFCNMQLHRPKGLQPMTHYSQNIKLRIAPSPIMVQIILQPWKRAPPPPLSNDLHWRLHSKMASGRPPENHENLTDHRAIYTDG